MLARFFRRAPKQKPTASTAGRLIYAIGDIHGRAELLDQILTVIAEDAAPRNAEHPLIIFVGDYIDRGPDSAGVVDSVLKLKAGGSFDVRALKGNHEQAILHFIDDWSFGPVWAKHGGAATLRSYGVTPPQDLTDAEAWQPAQAALEAAIPTSHRLFYCGLELMVTVGDYVFVHAGVRPGVPLQRQTETDLLWIRSEFLKAEGPFEKIIVHGHTPKRQPQISDHRLGIDTGAYYSGVLTAVRLADGDVKILQAVDEQGSEAAVEEDTAVDIYAIPAIPLSPG